MNLLAIDTSTEIASVAVKTDQGLFCEEQDGQKTHALLVLPMIDKLMRCAGLQMNNLDGIIFGCGPGSFTGLRIACSVAKGLAYAHDLKLTPVSSLATIAWKVRELNKNNEESILAVLDARMHEMYWSYFAPSQPLLLSQDLVSSAQDIQIPNHHPLAIAGVGIELYWDELSPNIKAQVSTQMVLYPKASDMINLTLHAGLKSVSVDQAQPVYVRNHVTQGGPRG